MVTDPAPRILLVEDDDDLLEMASRMLVAFGYEVVEASAAEAVRDRIVDLRDIDVLFTDIVLPGASGLDLAADLTSERPDLAVLFTTGQVEAERHDEIRATGHPLLLKPYTADSLRDALRAVREGGDGAAGDRP